MQVGELKNGWLLKWEDSEYEHYWDFNGFTKEDILAKIQQCLDFDVISIKHFKRRIMQAAEAWTASEDHAVIFDDSNLKISIYKVTFETRLTFYVKENGWTNLTKSASLQ